MNVNPLRQLVLLIGVALSLGVSPLAKVAADDPKPAPAPAPAPTPAPPPEPSPPPPPPPPADAAYKNPDLPFEVRVKDLIRWMTLEEKASQIEMLSPAIPRLGVPGCNWWSEGLHGVARAGNATVFPQAIMLAATWNPDLLHQVASAIGDEARVKVDPTGVARYRGLTYWCPTINMARDARWGRCEETYGEDPFLTGRLAVAYVKGMQGDDPKYLKLAATPKHFALHSQETGRARSSFDVTDRQLHEYYLPAFEAAFREGRAASVMAAFSGINSVPCTANPWLLTDLLRDQWTFDGAAVSDWGGVRRLRDQHAFVATDEEAVAKALGAGLDVICDPRPMHREIINAVNSGVLKMDVLERALGRALMVRFRLGMFDPPARVKYTQLPASTIGRPEHVRLALESARQGIVLLKNEPAAPGSGYEKILPIDATALESVAVMGPYANMTQFGAYSGVPANVPVNPMEGIRALLPERVRLLTARWDNTEAAVRCAREADLVILVLGISGRIEREGVDRQFIDLPKDQEAFLKKIVAANQAVVLVLEGGSPLAVPWAQENVPAIVMLWYPGEQGGTALGETLFGQNNPAGRLPITFPRALEDLPPLDNYDLTQGRTYMYPVKPPLYPFGFGLSYTQFEYRNPRLSAAAIPADGKVNLTVDVANTGAYDGDEVVQVYAKLNAWPVPAPAQKLVGFARVRVAKGASATATISVQAKDLAYWEEKQQKFVTPAGRYELLMAASATDVRQRVTLEVK